MFTIKDIPKILGFFPLTVKRGMSDIMSATQNQHFFVCYLFMADHFITISFSEEKKKTFFPAVCENNKKIMSREQEVFILVIF